MIIYINKPQMLNCFKSKKIKLILDDINYLLYINNRNKKQYICNHILNKIVQLTHSEYGFIGIIDKSKENLKIYSITNISWNKISHDRYINHLNGSKINYFHIENTFKNIIQTYKSKFNNKNIIKINQLNLHPIIKKFMGIVPNIYYDENNLLFVGLCNKFDNYTNKDIKNVEIILDKLSYLFINLINFNEVDENIV